MRNWINLIEGEAPEVLYHGSRAKELSGIEQHGLSPEYDESWREHGPAVYLTDDVGTARGYGEAVFAVRVSDLDANLLGVDDQEFYDFLQGEFEIDGEDPEDYALFSTWRDSIKLVNQCKYYGVIPYGLLTRVNTE